ncbi:MAG TPA: glycine cleavage T C-terminal barrel domain-containing protein [Acidimicrobiia bacterium]|nr:glycine cleavage T C-terminal barrel domain-containing protein [Acidimicrobiia bacterium]
MNDGSVNEEETVVANERSEMLERSTTLYFGPWYRRSPFFESTLAAGCTSYDIYNHMYLPAYYDDPDVEYWALVNGVTMWDVGVERTVEVSGPDADRLIDFITCRDLTKCAVGQGKYMPVIAPDGGIVNDPVLLHVAVDKWWMQLADSDAGLYALGVAAGRFDVDVTLPDVHPMQVQGPLAAKTLEKLVGPAVYDIKYYWLGEFEVNGIPVVISRTGWTAIPGFEINVLDRRDGAALWDAVARAGEEFDIRPIAPCEARRIEAGIFNYGSDMTLDDTPFHITGMERLVEPQEQDYLGKGSLERLRETGVDRKLVGMVIEGDQLRAELSQPWPVLSSGGEVGRVTDAVWSPGMEQNIGYMWVPIELAEPGSRVDVINEDGEELVAVAASIPFVDPQKKEPARSLNAT